MEQFRNLDSTMETRDHSKNGANLKNQMIKKIFMLFAIFVVIIGFTFNSCDSKEEKEKEPDRLEVNPTNIDVGSEYGNFSISISSNCDWSAWHPTSWCLVNGPTSGHGNGVLFFIVETNTSASTRNATIVVQGGELQKTISVTQAGTTNTGGGSGTLSAPTGVTATQSGSTIRVSWNSVPGATSYIIYWSSNTGIFRYDGTSSSTNYTDSYPNDGYNYYKVSAVNNAGESAQSDYAYCIYSSGGGGDTKPNTPTGVTATQSGTTVRVSWNSVSGATSYRIYWSNSATGTYQYDGSSSSTNYTDSSPINGNNYYKVSSVNNAGESAQSSYAYCNYSSGGGGGGNTNYEPCPVQNPTASGSSYITVSWYAATSTGCGTPTSYEVYKRNPNNGQYELKTTSSSTSYSDNSAHPGINMYGIKAKNSYGTSGANYAQSSEVPLSVPTGFNASKSGSNVTFSWSKVTAATGYQIFEATSASGTYTILDQINENTTSHTRYYPASSGTTRYFKIKAMWKLPYSTPSVVYSDLSSYKSVTF